LRCRPNDNGVSPFWSGAVVTGPNGNFNGVLAFWNVPTISQPTEAQGSEGGWDSSSWAGIDGWTSNDLLQAGVQQYLSGPGAKPQYIAWYQWWIAPPTNPPAGPLDANGYPEAWVNSRNGTFQYIYQTNYKNFDVTAGDAVMTAIVYRENAAGTVQFSNITTGQTLHPQSEAAADSSVRGEQRRVDHGVAERRLAQHVLAEIHSDPVRRSLRHNPKLSVRWTSGQRPYSQDAGQRNSGYDSFGRRHRLSLAAPTLSRHRYKT
jgi:Peptidase A4 family